MRSQSVAGTRLRDDRTLVVMRRCSPAWSTNTFSTLSDQMFGPGSKRPAFTTHSYPLKLTHRGGVEVLGSPVTIGREQRDTEGMAADVGDGSIGLAEPPHATASPVTRVAPTRIVNARFPPTGAGGASREKSMIIFAMSAGGLN